MVSTTLPPSQQLAYQTRAKGNTPETLTLFEDPSTGPELAALEHALLLHPEGQKGTVVFGRRFPEEPEKKDQWKQTIVRAEQAPEQAATYAMLSDVYMTMNRFKGPRKTERLLVFNAVYSDTDYYKDPELADKPIEEIVAMGLELLREAGLPEPSLIYSSGQGLAWVYLIEPIPKAAEVRWGLVQDRILEILEPLGSDPQAVDAARVLRIAGTINSKNGGLVEMVGGTQERYPFDQLADAVLDYTREQVRRFREKNPRRSSDIRVWRSLRAPKTPSKGQRGAPKGSAESERRNLAERRLRALHKLRDLRYGSEKPMHDYRDRWLFVAACEMAWLVEPAVLEDEILNLAESIGYPAKTARSNMQTVVKRARRAARGEKITYRGQERDPRYHHTNEKIIERLEITPEELEEMPTLTKKTTTTKKSDRDRKREQRRAAGVADRKAKAAHNRSEVLRLTLEGKTRGEVAEALGLSESGVKKIKRELRQEGALDNEKPIDKPKEGVTEGGSLSVPCIAAGCVPAGDSEREESFVVGEGSLSVHTESQGEVIEAEFREAAEHSLSCDCLSCSVSAPKYARLA